MEIISDKDNPSNRNILKDIEKLNEEYRTICLEFTNAEYDRYEEMCKAFMEIYDFKKPATIEELEKRLKGDEYKGIREKLKEKTKKEQLKCIKSYIWRQLNDLENMFMKRAVPKNELMNQLSFEYEHPSLIGIWDGKLK